MIFREVIPLRLPNLFPKGSKDGFQYIEDCYSLLISSLNDPWNREQVARDVEDGECRRGSVVGQFSLPDGYIKI